MASQLDTTGAKFLVHGALTSPLDSSGALSAVPAAPWRDAELPFAGDANKYFLDDFPDWGVGFGYSAYFADLSGITSVLTKVENRYRNLGYDILSNSLNTHVSPLRLIDLKIRFSSSFGALCEAGKAIGSDNVLLEWFSASLLYRFRHSKRRDYFHLLEQASLSFILAPIRITITGFLPSIRSINIRPNILNWNRSPFLHRRPA